MFCVWHYSVTKYFRDIDLSLNSFPTVSKERKRKRRLSETIRETIERERQEREQQEESETSSQVGTHKQSEVKVGCNFHEVDSLLTVDLCTEIFLINPNIHRINSYCVYNT